jgi:hypothetical protein
MRQVLFFRREFFECYMSEFRISSSSSQSFSTAVRILSSADSVCLIFCRFRFQLYADHGCTGNLCDRPLFSPGPAYQLSYRLRGGSLSLEPTEGTFGEVEFSLGEEESEANGQTETVVQANPAIVSTQSTALDNVIDSDNTARVIECKFMHDGDKNGVIYYLGMNFRLTFDMSLKPLLSTGTHPSNISEQESLIRSLRGEKYAFVNPAKTVRQHFCVDE